MDLLDISNVTQDYLFALSCLDTPLHEKLVTEWSNRFDASSALLVQVDRVDDAPAIRTKVIDGINSRNFHLPQGSNVCAAVFLDLTQAFNADQLAEIHNTLSWLQMHLSVTYQIVSYFGFVGTAGVFNQQQIRDNIGLIQTTIHREHKLWLVAEPILRDQLDNIWKPSVLFVDVLRRDSQQCANFANQITYTDGCIGFFRYGEYNEEKLQCILGKIDKLEYWLNNGKNQILAEDIKSKFEKQINSLFSKLDEEARRSFAAEATLQPIHPDMYPKRIIDICKAKKNRGKFLEAKIQTERAVKATAENLKQQIKEFCKNKIGDSKVCLMNQLTDADVSFSFVENKSVVKSILQEFQGNGRMTSLPPLSYCKDGYTDVIEKYLDEVFDCAITDAKNEVATDLLKAYAQFSEEKIKQKREELIAQLAEIEAKKKTLLDRDTFCLNAIDPLHTGQGMTKDFHPVMQAPGDRTDAFLVCSRSDDWNWIQTLEVYSEANVRFISAQNGGVVTPIKSLYAVYFECTPKRIDDLLQ